MPKDAPFRARVPLIVSAVVQPVSKRLARMEALLMEMRHEQDVQLKRVAALRAQLDMASEQIAVNTAVIRRLVGRPDTRTRVMKKGRA